MSSVGAVTAAQSGRGNRFFDRENGNQDYQVTLPQLPTGKYVTNTVFLHGGMRARPYRVEDFRDALTRLALLPEVIALGAYQMNHVWVVTFSSADAVKKMLAVGDVKVKERKCLVIDPNNQDLRLKLQWFLHGVPDDEVRSAFAQYGRVTDVSRERWRAPGCVEKGSTTRHVTIRLKAGVMPEDLPHQLSVGGELTLVVVPGRAQLCLRCNRQGHVRRECLVPRCSLCRRFGHPDSECVKTYATVAGPTGVEDKSEHLMDEADAEEAASGGAGPSLEPEPTPSSEGKKISHMVTGPHRVTKAATTGIVRSAPGCTGGAMLVGTAPGSSVTIASVPSSVLRASGEEIVDAAASPTDVDATTATPD
ncbi:uncharacterized protein LOC144160604 [Haemaphysalis longicornis]